MNELKLKLGFYNFIFMVCIVTEETSPFVDSIPLYWSGHKTIQGLKFSRHKTILKP